MEENTRRDRDGASFFRGIVYLYTDEGGGLHQNEESYPNLHAYLLQRDCFLLQQAILMALPKPQMQAYFREKANPAPPIVVESSTLKSENQISKNIQIDTEVSRTTDVFGKHLREF